MTPKQEIRRIAKSRIPSIVEERIILEMLDGIADWSGELVGKLTTLSDDEKEISRAWEIPLAIRFPMCGARALRSGDQTENATRHGS